MRDDETHERQHRMVYGTSADVAGTSTHLHPSLFPLRSASPSPQISTHQTRCHVGRYRLG
jgi:hypothetical protein